MYENMGQTIAKLRRDRNLTQEKLAELTAPRQEEPAAGEMKLE